MVSRQVVLLNRAKSGEWLYGRYVKEARKQNIKPEKESNYYAIQKRREKVIKPVKVKKRKYAELKQYFFRKHTRKYKKKKSTKKELIKLVKTIKKKKRQRERIKIKKQKEKQKEIKQLKKYSQKKILIDVLDKKLSYAQARKRFKELRLKFISSKNYNILLKEQQGKKVTKKELKLIEKYKKIREKVFKKDEQRYANYSIEIKGYCSVYKRFPGGRKKFVRNELVTGGCQLNYQDAKDEFKARFEERQEAIYQSKREELVLDSTQIKKWCL